MTVVRLKGLNKATKRLADGRRVTYWYAWRGGPKLEGRPGSPEFMQGYHAAHKARKRPTASTLASLVALYRDSPEWRKTADSTKREWNRWLDRIMTGELRDFDYASLSDPDCTADVLKWRDQWADKPRTADYAIQVLSRLLGWAKGRRLVSHNACEGIEKLYESDRADQIWTDDERARYAMWAPSTEVAFIIDLACLTGLRREDLAALKWADVGELYFSKTTSKSRGRTSATIPLLAETRELLKKIKTQQEMSAKIGQLPEHVLTNTRGRPWTPSGLSHAVTAFGGKRLHDCRGTLATILRRAGLKASEIADIMGWREDRVERLLSVYVDRDAIVRALAERIGRNEG